MGKRIGTGYVGTDSIKTSVANEELVPQPPQGWVGGFSLYKLSFFNKQDCKVKINNSSEIFLKAQQGFSTSEIDATIHSFKIVTAGVDYNFIGAY